MNLKIEKQLIACLDCGRQGTVNVLGEMTNDGAFQVLRFHRGYSIIRAEHFSVTCQNGHQAAFTQGTYSI